MQPTMLRLTTELRAVLIELAKQREIGLVVLVEELLRESKSVNVIRRELGLKWVDRIAQGHYERGPKKVKS